MNVICGDFVGFHGYSQTAFSLHRGFFISLVVGFIERQLVLP